MFSSFGYKILALLVAVAGVANAQLTYFTTSAEIQPGWTGSAGAVGEGNGIFLSPDGALLVVVSSDASAKGFDAASGTELWTFAAPSATATSTSGVFFSYGATNPYLCYSFDDANTTSVLALSPTGTEILRTGPVQGVAAGTPVTSEDGEFIMTTYNFGTQGFFAVFEISEPGTPLLSYSHPTITDEPFGAVGVFWSPSEGNYPGGELNTNDIFIWSFDTNLVKTNGTVGTGQVFVFQMPTNPMSVNNVTLLDGMYDFQANLPPVLTDNGLSMYWSATRSKVYAWKGDGSNRLDFTTNGIEQAEFERSTGDIKSASAMAPPTLSNANGTEGFVVGPTASTQIFRLDRNFSDLPGTIITTAAVVSSRLLVSPDDMFVYYATPPPDSSLYQLDSTTLAEVWKVTLPNGVVGDIAMSKSGASIIVADIAGTVTSFVVATAGPTPPPAPVAVTAPVSAPVAGGTPSPSLTMVPTTTPVPTMTMPPVDATTPTAPTAPTAPVTGPVATPVKAPTSVTTPTASGAVSQFLLSMVSSTILATMMAIIF